MGCDRMPDDAAIVAHADDLRRLSAETRVPDVLLAKRLLEMARDPAALERWPVQLGRVARLAERRRRARSRRLVVH